MATTSTDDRYLTLKQLAHYSNVSISTLRRRLHDPKCPLPHRRLGRRILILRSVFDRWMAGTC